MSYRNNLAQLKLSAQVVPYACLRACRSAPRSAQNREHRRNGRRNGLIARTSVLNARVVQFPYGGPLQCDEQLKTEVLKGLKTDDLALKQNACR